MPAGIVARLSQAKRAQDYDVTVLQKRLLPKMILNRLRKNAKALIFEFDDVVTLKRDDEGTIRESPTKDRRFRRTVRVADAIVTTNETLAEHARRNGADLDRVHVLPTVIDLARWAPRDHAASAEVTIGWMGTPANLASLEIVKTPLTRLCRRHEGLRIKVVCEESLAAMDQGLPLHGICLYPILNHPGWVDDRHCHNGLWDYPDPNGNREICKPLAAEIRRWRPVFERELVSDHAKATLLNVQ
jgi:hypothetical protein